MTQLIEEIKSVIEHACRAEVQTRCVNQGLTDRGNLSIRQLFPTDLGLITDTWEIDLNDCNIGSYNTIVDKQLCNKIICIYGFRILGNDFPVTVVNIKITEKCKSTNIKCYVEHLVDREYYFLDNPTVVNLYSEIEIKYFIKRNKPSQIHILGYIGEKKHD